MIYKNLLTVARNPSIGIEYLWWLFRFLITDGGPTRRLYKNIEIGSFANFSEYHMCKEFIDEKNLFFLRNYDFNPGIMIDIGANLGIVSLILTKRFPERTIHAIEPNPSTFNALVANIARNNANLIMAHDIVISDREGTVFFDANPVARGTASIADCTAKHALQIRALSLDAFAETTDIDQIAFLKVDVEGFESLVFSDAKMVLSNLRPVILFEVCPQLSIIRGFDPKDSANQLESFRYKLYRLGNDGRLINADAADVSEVRLENWVAVPQ